MDKLKGSWYRSMKAFGIFCGSPIMEAAPKVRNVSQVKTGDTKGSQQLFIYVTRNNPLGGIFINSIPFFN